ncbi:MAG TPA: sigma-54 dependent transcriptional regulator [Longimicrobiaceae bacterium]|nr:sigma-54 dependent transcriptional regulator [Longimicrobiaceae bacterium]
MLSRQPPRLARAEPRWVPVAAPPQRPRSSRTAFAGELMRHNDLAGFDDLLPAGESGRGGTSTTMARRSRKAPELIGNSRAMQRLRKLALRVAPKDATVFINGESGTGKEMFARFIHAHSRRADRPFVALNCAALPENLVESELFGHERGAFTGAVTTRTGCFEAAHHGTLFLDEITEIRPAVQAKLLRAIQEREVQRVGSNDTRPVDVRILVASSRDLAQALADGVLREDLYYRLQVVELNLPPLRTRKEDVPLLCSHFLKKHGGSEDSPLRHLSLSALELLEAYDWPGNVRELENVVGRAIAIAAPDSGDTLHPFDLPPAIWRDHGMLDGESPEMELNLNAAVLRLKRLLSAEALHRANGNKMEAARLLGVSRRGFYNLLKETEM